MPTKPQQIESDLSLISALEWWAKNCDDADLASTLSDAAKRLATFCGKPKLAKAGPTLRMVAAKVMAAVPGDGFRPDEFMLGMTTKADRRKIYSALHELVRQGVLVKQGYGRFIRFDG